MAQGYGISEYDIQEVVFEDRDIFLTYHSLIHSKASSSSYLEFQLKDLAELRDREEDKAIIFVAQQKEKNLIIIFKSLEEQKYWFVLFKAMNSNDCILKSLVNPGITKLHQAMLYHYFFREPSKFLINIADKQTFHQLAKTPDSQGVLPVHIAAYCNLSDEIDMLANNGSLLNYPTESGFSALRYCLQSEGQYEAFSALIEHGADYTRIEKAGN